MGTVLRVLVVEDSTDDYSLLLRELRRAGFAPDATRVESGAELAAALGQGPWDIVLSDFSLPSFQAPAALRAVRARDAHVPFVIVSGTIGEGVAVEAMRAGASDYLLKDNLARLGAVVEREVREAQERRAARETLRESETLLALVFDSVADPLFSLLVEGEGVYRFVAVNEVFLRATGLGRDRVVGRLVEEVLPPSSHELVKGHYREAIRTRTQTRWTEIAEFPAGKRVGEVCVMPVFDAAGRCTHIVGSVHDITDRVRSEEALRQAELRLVQFLENMPLAGVFVLDAEGRPAYANSKAIELLGKGVEPSATPARLADTDRAFVAGTSDPYPSERMPIVRALRGESSMVDDMEIRSEGRRALLEVWGCPIRDSAGRVAYALAAFNDITERRKLEQQFRQAQKMEAVGRLAGGVAHDFNNILTGIIGYSDLLLRRLSPLDPLRPDLEEIRKLGDRAAGLTRQLLAFSRQQVLQPRVLDPNAIVSGIEKMLRRLIGEDVDLRMALGRDVGRVRADPGSLEQVVMNLAVNARDAMPKGGKLAIETANSEADEGTIAKHPGTRRGPHVLIAVTDTGTGMDPGTLAHLFEPFFTTKPQGKGTGLGLSTVYGIVQQSGGHVAVYSEPGRGSTFKVYLPRVDAPAEVALPAEAAPAELRGSETVLVVEDEAGLREIARRVLTEAGYRVLEGTNGREALVLAIHHEGPIHVLLTDVVMPEMSGPELVRKLQFARPDTRVLYTSGYTAHGALQNGSLAAGVAFLMKPFAPDALLRKVRDVLAASPGEGPREKRP